MNRAIYLTKSFVLEVHSRDSVSAIVSDKPLEVNPLGEEILFRYIVEDIPSANL